MKSRNFFPTEWGWQGYEAGLKELAQKQVRFDRKVETASKAWIEDAAFALGSWELQQIRARRIPSALERSIKGDEFEQRFEVLRRHVEREIEGSWTQQEQKRREMLAGVKSRQVWNACETEQRNSLSW